MLQSGIDLYRVFISSIVSLLSGPNGLVVVAGQQTQGKGIHIFLFCNTKIVVAL